MDFMPLIIGGEDEIDIEPEIIDQPKLAEDDIFVKPKKKNIKVIQKEVIDEETHEVNPNMIYKEEEEIKDDDKVEISAKTGKPKRKQSEKQKIALKKGRERALANRQAKALELKNKKAEIKRLKNEKLDREIGGLQHDIQEKKKKYPFVQKEEPKEEILDEPSITARKPRSKTPINKTYTQEDVDNITFHAIQNYDAVKKSRKKEKMEKQKKDNEDEIERQKLLNIVKNVRPTDPNAEYWGNCF